MSSPQHVIDLTDAGLEAQREAVRVVVAMRRQLFAEVLRVALAERGGFAVSGAVSPDDRTARAQLAAADVVLLDVEPGDASGLALLRDLRASSPQTAVLVLSDSSDAQLLSDVMAAGAAGFLSLETQMAEVISAVHQAASGQVVLSGRRLAALVRFLADRATPAACAGPGGELTPREKEVLTLLTQGRSTRDISATLNVTPYTARTHVRNVLAKLGVHSRLEAAAYAVRHGLVEGP